MEARQLSLFGRGEPALRCEVGRAHRTWLGAGAWVDHLAGWIEGHDVLFERLEDGVAWESEQRVMYERQVEVPRLTASLALGAAPEVLQRAAAALAEHYAAEFDRVGLALYRGGRDSVAWHRDKVLRELPEAMVAIVSLGGPRRFLMRPYGGGRSVRFCLGGGDLFVMGGTSQRTWEHCVPKVATAPPRLSIMFRHGWLDR